MNLHNISGDVVIDYLHARFGREFEFWRAPEPQVIEGRWGPINYRARGGRPEMSPFVINADTLRGYIDAARNWDQGGRRP